MDPLFDEISSLIKLEVGDPYRLEHIKSRIERNMVLTLSDSKYISGLLALSNLRNVEGDESQTIATNSAIFSTVNSEFNYCWNCNKKNPVANAFCTSCESSMNTKRSRTENKLQKKIFKTKKIRKKLVLLGIIIMTFGSGAFIVPFGESSWIVTDMNAFCDSGLGLTVQAFFGGQGHEDCDISFQLLLFADFLEIIGITLIILGLTMKKTVLQIKP
jgi:hypothetical protein